MSTVLANVQSAAVGALVAPWAVLPVTAFHYLVFLDFSYTTYAQWQWDLIAAAVQGAAFAIAYRAAVRKDVFDANPLGKVVLAITVLRTFTRVQVPDECVAGDSTPLYCAGSFEPFNILSDTMAGELGVNFAESLVLFSVTAGVMNYCLQKNYIKPKLD